MGSGERFELDVEPILAVLGRASEALSTTNQKLADLLQNLAQVTATMKNLEASTISKFDGLAQSNTELRAAVFARLDRMQGTLDLVKEDMNVNFASSHTALSNARNTRQEADGLAQLVYAMQRQYKLLASQMEELRNERLDRDSPPRTP